MKDRQHLARRIDTILKAVQSLWSHWNYVMKKGDRLTLNTALLALPDHMPGPVLLDATASQNKVWELFGEGADVIDTPTKARSYANVTLHVAQRTKGLGKGKMTANAKDRCGRLLANLTENVSPDSKVWVCCHKDVEHHLVGADVPFEDFDTGHWNAIDGRNTWSTFDTAVIFGLPYRDRIWAINQYMAFMGLQSQEWLTTADEVRQGLIQSQMTVSVVQAINRVRCRRVVDGDGNCAPTNIYLLLPPDKTGDAILEGLKQEMADVNIQPWDFELHGLKERGKRKPRVRRSNHAEALIAYMRNRWPGDTAASAITKELGIPKRTWAWLVEQMKDETSDLCQRLQSIGVRLSQTGGGRGKRTYLIKA